jgi:hypothetical protein
LMACRLWMMAWCVCDHAHSKRQPQATHNKASATTATASYKPSYHHRSLCKSIEHTDYLYGMVLLLLLSYHRVLTCYCSSYLFVDVVLVIICLYLSSYYYY